MEATDSSEHLTCNAKGDCRAPAFASARSSCRAARYYFEIINFCNGVQLCYSDESHLCTCVRQCVSVCVSQRLLAFTALVTEASFYHILYVVRRYARTHTMHKQSISSYLKLTCYRCPIYCLSVGMSVCVVFCSGLGLWSPSLLLPPD